MPGLPLYMVTRSTTPAGPAPALTSENYATVDATGGDKITFTGTDIDTGGAPTCDFDGTPATVDSYSSTSVTIITPATSGGNKSVTVANGNGTSNARTIKVVDIESWAWTLKEPASSYTGSPMGVFSEATNPPSVGTAVNGYTPADYDGVNDLMTSASNLSAYIAGGSGTASTVIILANADTVAADAAGGSPFNNEAICARSSGGHFGMGISTAGLRCYVNDGAYKQTTPASVACPTGSWRFTWMRWSGGSMDQGVDVAPTPGLTPASTNGPGSLVMPMLLGRTGPVAAFFDGKILEQRAIKSALSDSQINDYIATRRCRYAI